MEDLDSALALCDASVTEREAISVEWPHFNLDWLLSNRLFCENKGDTWLNTTRSSDFVFQVK